MYASQELVDNIGLDAPYKDYPWVHHTEQMQSVWLDLWLKKNAPGASIALRVDSAVAARQAVESGLGVHFLPSAYTENASNLVRIGLEAGKVSLWFLTHPDLKNNGRVNAFSDFMFKQLRKRVFSDMLDKAWTRFTFNIWAPQNPPSPNELLSKGYRFAQIKASAQASHKTHVYG